MCPQAIPSRFPHHCTYEVHLHNSYSSMFDACPPVLCKWTYLPWLLRFPLCDTANPSLIPGVCLEIRRCSSWLRLFPFRNILPQHSSPLQSRTKRLFYPALPSLTCDTPGISHLPHPEGEPCTFSIKNWKTSAVSKSDWMVETHLCKLRGASDTFVGRAYFIFHL